MPDIPITVGAWAVASTWTAGATITPTTLQPATTTYEPTFAAATMNSPVAPVAWAVAAAFSEATASLVAIVPAAFAVAASFAEAAAPLNIGITPAAAAVAMTIGDANIRTLQPAAWGVRFQIRAA